MAKILVVEDDKGTRELVVDALRSQNYSVESCGTGTDAEFQFKTYDYDLILLDLDLPGKSGLDLCKDFRAQGGNTPILMLTGKDQIVDKETGLDSGADDYLTKPFDSRELLARVRTLLRRPASLLEDKLRAGNLVLDVNQFSVMVDDQPVDLNAGELKLLEFLIRHPNQVFHPDALLNRVWASDSEASIDALRSALKRLRKKLGSAGEMIHTVHGVGYVLRPK